VKLILACKKGLAVLVKLQLGDDHLGRVDTDWHSGGTVVLLTSDAFNVDHVFLTVHLCDLAVAQFEVATDNRDFVVLADRHGSYIVLALKLLGKRGAHDLPAHTGRC